MSRHALIALTVLVVVSTTPLLGQTQRRGGSGADKMGRKFEAQGVQVGESIDDEIVVYSLDGEEITVGELRGDGSTVLVTGSTTCPAAQKNCPRLAALNSLGAEVGVFVLYTIEAHPKGNEQGVYERSGGGGGRGQSAGRSGARRGVNPRRSSRGSVVGSEEQPESLDERLDLATAFQQQVVGNDVQVVVDNMDNQLWTALGAGPNLAVLLDAEGVVVQKHGWVDIEALRSELE